MSAIARFRTVGAGGLLVCALAVLAAPGVASDRSDEADVDLTLVSGGTDFTNSVGMKLVRIRAGTFLMGAPKDDPQATASEQPQHEVEFTRPFYCGAHEVTQKQYKAVMGANPSRNNKGNETEEFPVENVSRPNAIEFAKKLTALAAERRFRVTYRLPTEAEWEYCCRAGTTTLYSFGKQIDASLANYDGSPHKRTVKVGSYKPNAWGLYDMHGNVWEWVADAYDANYYKISPRKDPTGPAQGNSSIIRGGGWYSNTTSCRAAFRNNYSGAADSLGFRVVAVPDR